MASSAKDQADRRTSGNGMYSLKWNNHSQTFLQVISNLHTNLTYHDASIACSGKLYPVHKVVLSTCSEYFQTIFLSLQDNHPVIIINDATCDIIEGLLKYMYFGEVKVMKDILSNFISIAKCLKIKGLAAPDIEPTIAARTPLTDEEMKRIIISGSLSGEKRRYQHNPKSSMMYPSPMKMQKITHQPYIDRTTAIDDKHSIRPTYVHSASDPEISNTGTTQTEYASPSSTTTNVMSTSSATTTSSELVAPTSSDTIGSSTSDTGATVPAMSSPAGGAFGSTALLSPAAVAVATTAIHTGTHGSHATKGSLGGVAAAVIEATGSNSTPSDMNVGRLLYQTSSNNQQQQPHQQQHAHPYPFSQMATTSQNYHRNIFRNMAAHSSTLSGNNLFQMPAAAPSASYPYKQRSSTSGTNPTDSTSEDNLQDLMGIEFEPNNFTFDDPSMQSLDSVTKSSSLTSKISSTSLKPESTQRSGDRAGSSNNSGVTFLCNESGSSSFSPLAINAAAAAAVSDFSARYSDTYPQNFCKVDYYNQSSSQSSVSAGRTGTPSSETSSPSVLMKVESPSTSSQTAYLDECRSPYSNILSERPGRKSKVAYEERPFPCPYCSYRASYKGNLNIHLRKHSHDKPFVCAMCGFRTAFKQSLQTHAKKLHPDLSANPS